MSTDAQLQWFSEKMAKEGSGFCLAIKEKLHEESSPYQKIEVYDTHTFGKLLVLDGCIMCTDRDSAIYHEMMSHPALFTHKNPKKVAIIGGGDCGVLTEVLKHEQVEQAWQVDIDERVTEMAKRYYSHWYEASLDPRAKLEFTDGVEWVSNQVRESLDVVIIDSTDPVGPAEALFAESFFAKCFKVLGADGIFVQQSESPLYHTNSIIQPMHEALRTVGFSSVCTLTFPQAIYPSGWWSATIAGKNTDVSVFRESAALQKIFSTFYYNAALHRGAMQLPEFMQTALYFAD